MRRFAEDTAVPVSRSRGEVDALLEAWGAIGVQWTTESDSVCLRFLWRHEETKANYMVRIRCALPAKSDLEEHALDGRTGKVSQSKLLDLIQRRGRREHRLLLLWIRAMLNAIDSGMVTAAEVFLPFIEDKSGRTVADVIVPKLAKVHEGADRLLPAASR